MFLHSCIHTENPYAFHEVLLSRNVLGKFLRHTFMYLTTEIVYVAYYRGRFSSCSSASSEAYYCGLYPQGLWLSNGGLPRSRY